MSLRTRIIIIVTVVFVIAFTTIAVLMGQFLINKYRQEETLNTYDKLFRAKSTLEEAIANLDNLTGDWAEWDDTYQFIQDTNQAYLTDNLINNTFINNRLNLMVYLNVTGNIVFAKSYNTASGQMVPVSDALLNYLKPDSRLIIHSEGDDGVSGILSLPDYPVLISSHPILNSQGEGPIRGTLIFGRFLDAEELTRISRLTRLSLGGYTPNNVNMPQDYKFAYNELTQKLPSFIKPLDDNTIAGYMLFYDINGKPAYILRVDAPRSIYIQGRNDIFYFTMATFAFGLLFIVVISLTLEKLVISRISNLSSRVNIIGQKGDLSSRITLPGKDELSSLATNINNMLQQLQTTTRLQKESETFNTVLLRDSPNPILVLNPDASIRYANPALEKITGFSQAQIIGRKPPYPWWFAENIQEYARDLYNVSIAGINQLERRFHRTDGKPFWIFVTSTVVKQDGKTEFIIANWVDITERKKAEEAVQESEKRFRQMSELLPELVFETDIEGKLTFVNRIAFNVFGYLPEEHGNLRLFDLFSFNEQEKVKENMHKILSGDYLGNVEHIAIRKDRRELPTILHATPIKNSPGEIVGIRGILVDITAQKEIESELRSSEEFSRSLRDHSPFPILVINPDSSIRYVNPALEKLTGYSSSELVGINEPYPWWPKDQIQHYSETLKRSFISPSFFEVIFQKKSGESCYIRINSTPVQNNAKVQYILSIWVDITAQKLASQELEHLYQREKSITEALQTEIRSRTEFTRALVHELKTPLTPIMASSELLAEELKQEPYLSLAKNIFQGAENMNRRVDELLDLARGEVGMLKVNLRPVDSEKLLREAVEYMEPAVHNSEQTLKISLPTKLPVIIADDERVRQIMYNLINNAVKYSSPRTDILVTAREEGDYLVVDIQDHGRGMTEDEQTKLFQPYYRIEGRDRLSGLGLGLALSRKLIELQNGKIWAISQKGVGSTFSFALPIRKGTRNDNIDKPGGKL